jgi:hypothetical protein
VISDSSCAPNISNSCLFPPPQGEFTNKSIINKEKPILEIEKALKKKEAAALLKDIAKALESDAAKTVKVGKLTF